MIKMKKKFLSQNDLLEVIGYSEDNIMDIIKDGITDEVVERVNPDEGILDLVYQYSVFFNRNGEIILAFRIDEQNKNNYKKIMIG